MEHYPGYEAAARKYEAKEETEITDEECIQIHLEEKIENELQKAGVI